MQKFDVLVLGAGMVGVSSAIHAQRSGLKVALVDRRGAGEETSFGNSGVIDSDSLLPTSMPTNFSEIFKFALNNQSKAHYQLSGVLNNAKWLYDYWRYSHEDKQIETAKASRELFSHVAKEHKQLANDAKSTHHLRETGWLKLYRSEESLATTALELKMAKDFGLEHIKLSQGEVLELEPHLKPVFVGGVWSKGAITVDNPGVLTKSYAALFVNEGGSLLTGDAQTLTKSANGWQVKTQIGVIEATRVVVALGAWSPDLLIKFGHSFPLNVKRGYHQHYKANGNALLYRQVCDVDVGYVLCPMEMGLRLTTGVEIANRDAAKTPVQLARCLPKLRELFDVGEEIGEFWQGNRPCFPDSRPIIDFAPNDKSMVLAFGHGHWGFTQGPATGKAVAQLLSQQTPFLNLKPYSATRFGDDW